MITPTKPEDCDQINKNKMKVVPAIVRVTAQKLKTWRFKSS